AALAAVGRGAVDLDRLLLHLLRAIGDDVVAVEVERTRCRRFAAERFRTVVVAEVRVRRVVPVACAVEMGGGAGGWVELGGLDGHGRTRSRWGIRERMFKPATHLPPSWGVPHLGYAPCHSGAMPALVRR